MHMCLGHLIILFATHCIDVKLTGESDLDYLKEQIGMVMLSKGSLMNSVIKCFVSFCPFHGQKKEDLLDIERKLKVRREGSMMSKCF